MGKINKIIMDVAFPDDVRARHFAEYCLHNFNNAPAVNRRKVYLVLQTLDDKVAALKEVERLNGTLINIKE